MLLRPEQIPEADGVQGMIEEKEARLQTLRRELNAIERRIDDLITLLASTCLTNRPLRPDSNRFGSGRSSSPRRSRGFKARSTT